MVLLVNFEKEGYGEEKMRKKEEDVLHVVREGTSWIRSARHWISSQIHQRDSVVTEALVLESEYLLLEHVRLSSCSHCAVQRL